ncbi:MAG TPA: SDR family oxidoreductase [Thermoanaerobaculia bacterium]|nr:SDR family oxidoreductase [Thermoanaerobaculia bacterium]
MKAGESGGTVLVLGAGSAIARAIALELAERGYGLQLAGRDMGELERIATDARVRHGVPAKALFFDALATDTHEAFLRESREASSDSLAGAVLCFGALGDQEEAQADPSEAKRILDTNFTGAVSILSLLANHFEERRSGFLCALSSVAGDRGRQSNYVYGAAKAGLTVFLQGLRNRLFRSGVRVITIKPGFVDTAMTFGRPGMFLVASPQAAAKRIVAAIEKGKDQAYVPGFWRFVMLAIRLLPERIFKRMRL